MTPFGNTPSDRLPDWLRLNPIGVSVTPDDLIARFDSRLDWEERYRTLLALGSELPPLPVDWCVDANRLHGCQATVWVAHGYDATSDTLYLNCCTETRLVQGLLACLLSGYNGKSPADAMAFDAGAFLQSLDFAGHIASERNNGLLAFIGRARMLAHRYTQTD